jgi:hypothetical protein
VSRIEGVPLQRLDHRRMRIDVDQLAVEDAERLACRTCL